MHLQSGKLLQGGKYKIIEKIGQGGFGIVYKAFHESLQCNVCIKEFFFSDLCERAKRSSKITIISSSAEKIQLVDSLKKKFIKEAQRLAQFQNPHIIHVMDNFEENNTAYFVMEYIEGGSLEDLIEHTGAMSEEKAKKIMLPIIEALEAVHTKGLLHLDIKPANILLRNDHSAVLIDFGISKYMEMAGNHTTTAPIGLSKGYAPMEQYGGTITDFSKATDVYSICATLYRMATGVTPPEPLQIHTIGIKSPRELNPQISLKFSNAILKGLSIKAMDRPQSMSELKSQLVNEERNNETVVPKLNNTKVDSATAITPIPAKKNITAWIIGGFVVIVAIIIGFSGIYHTSRPLETEPLPDIVVNNTDSTSITPTSNPQNTVNEPSKNESPQNTEKVSQTVDAVPTKNKSEIITGTVKDIDGNVYKTVKIGNQIWMAENLKVTHYRNGDAIPNISDINEWGKTVKGAYCNYDNNAAIGSEYGRLYNWFSVSDKRNLSPKGWHIATNEDWKELIKYLGGGRIAGGKLKEQGTIHWQSHNRGATNETGFSALPGGFCSKSLVDLTSTGNGFITCTTNGFWWSSTEYNENEAWFVNMYYFNSTIDRDHIVKEDSGYSVRCIKDN